MIDNEVLVKIKFLLPSLPKSERYAAEYMLNNPEDVRSMTLAILAQESKSSEASIIRLSRKLGFDGFSSLKQAYLATIVDENRNLVQEINSTDTIPEIFSKVVRNNVKTMQETMALVSNDYDRAVEMILSSRSIHFFGVGDAYVTGLLGYLKFSRIGFTGSAYSDVMLQDVTASTLTKDDIAFAISYSGASTTTVKAMRIAKESGAKTICITKTSKSPLIKYTDVNLYISTVDMTIGKDNVISRVADQVIIDTLYMSVLVRSGKDLASLLKKSQKAIDSNKM